VHCGFYFFTVQLLVLHAKNGAFGLLRLAVACTACREREREREREIYARALSVTESG